MLSGPWVYIVGLVASFTIATLASPAGVSGAVLLLPFQVSVLGTPSPAVTPTNLLYNVVATPGALFRYWRQNQTGGRLTRTLLVGTVPGVIAGSIIRVELVPGPKVFEGIIALVLIPLGASLLFRRDTAPNPGGLAARMSDSVLVAIALAIGCVGGIYGIGGGSILAPILISSGRPPRLVAPATLAVTFVTSIAGITTFVILSTHSHASVGPAWGVGIALGIGGLLGGYTGARLQPHLPEAAIRRLLGLLVLAIGTRYGYLAIP